MKILISSLGKHTFFLTIWGVHFSLRRIFLHAGVFGIVIYEYAQPDLENFQRQTITVIRQEKLFLGAVYHLLDCCVEITNGWPVECAHSQFSTSHVDHVEFTSQLLVTVDTSVQVNIELWDLLSICDKFWIVAEWLDESL